MSIFKVLFAPRLYRMYRRTSEAGEMYVPNMAEKFGDFFISYGIPCGGMYCMWQRRLNYFMYWSVLIASSYVFRAMGRAVNPTYLAFLEVLSRSKQALTTENLEQLRKYDFEFKSWPVAYKCSRQSLHAQKLSENPPEMSISWLLGWLVCHTFGIRLIYPGLLIGSFIRIPLEEARAKFVMERSGQRNRVQSVDGNGIDMMFFDRRNSVNQESGNILVICCEGNAGFYEVGMMGTPLELGYSILGWNHPGFGGSTGVPYPPAELNAAEAVYDYAVNSLGFKEEQIVLYGWSIGGFPATHLARSHPNVKGLILDATFDDILPLAIPKMPEVLSSLVVVTIRKHANLEITKELAGYGGPVRLIRRTEDEIISEPSGDLTQNRGNFLLKSLMHQRFPDLLDNAKAQNALDDWISKPHARDAAALLASLRDRSTFTLPENLKSLSDDQKTELVIKIALLILTDYKSTHCTPLPQSLFRLPWAHRSRPIDNAEDHMTQQAQ